MPPKGLNKFASELAHGITEKRILDAWGDAQARLDLHDLCVEHGEKVASRMRLPKERGIAIGSTVFDEVAPELDQAPHGHTVDSLAHLVDVRTNHHSHEQAALHRLTLPNNAAAGAEGVQGPNRIATIADPRVERSLELERSYELCAMLIELVIGALRRLSHKNAAGRMHAIAWLHFLLEGGPEPRPNHPLRDSLLVECNDREKRHPQGSLMASFYGELRNIFTPRGRGDRRLVKFFESIGEYGREAGLVALVHELHEVGGAPPDA